MALKLAYKNNVSYSRFQFALKKYFEFSPVNSKYLLQRPEIQPELHSEYLRWKNRELLGTLQRIFQTYKRTFIFYVMYYWKENWNQE